MPMPPATSGCSTVRAGGLSLRRWMVLVLLASATVLQTGCAGFRLFGMRQQADPLAGIPRPKFSEDPQLEEVVDHLNRNSQKLHAWRANTVKITANNMPLAGNLAVEEGQHLRLVVHSFAGQEVDLGSNDDVFWIWAKRMEPDPYIYCRHTQIDAARRTLGIPFEPQWLMQAMGVAPVDTGGMQMQIDSTGRRARLVQVVTTAHGIPIQKVMLVDLVHGIVLEHSIYNANGQKIASARLDRFHLDKPSGVVLPRRVNLNWPQNKMSLVMDFKEVEINPSSIPAQVWEMPRIPGVRMVDLGAESRSGIQYAGRDAETAVELMEPEESTGDENSGRFQAPNRAASSSSADASPPPKSRSGLVNPIQFSSDASGPANASKRRNWDED